MKAVILGIVGVAVLLGFLQGRESLRLGTREKELKELRAAGAAGVSEGGNAKGAAKEVAPAKIERKEHAKFDSKVYLAKCQELLAMMTAREPTIGGSDFMQSDLLDASVEDLLQLPDLFRESGMPEEFWEVIYESISTRLLDKDPRLACEFAIKGGEIENFILVMRTWISRDPGAAGEWLETKANVERSLDEKSFGTHLGHPEPLYVPGLQLAASIAGAPATADLGALEKLEGERLEATMDDVLHVLPPDGLPVLLKRLSESGREDLVEMAVKRYHEPALVREYLKGADLPAAPFAKAAEIVVSGLQPGDLPRGMEWYLQSTEPGLRGEGLERIVKSWTDENPRSAAAWIEKLPEGRDREMAKRAHEEALAHPRPKQGRER